MFYVVFTGGKICHFCFTKLRVFVYKRAGVYVKSNTYFHFTKEFVFPLSISAGGKPVFCLQVCRRGCKGVYFTREEFFCLCAEVYMLYNFLGVNCALLAKEVTLGVLF